MFTGIVFGVVLALIFIVQKLLSKPTPPFLPEQTGIPWYTPDEYKGMQSILPGDFQKSYEQWRSGAEAALRQSKKLGIAVTPVNIAPESFKAWCVQSENVLSKSALVLYVENCMKKQLDIS